MTLYFCVALRQLPSAVGGKTSTPFNHNCSPISLTGKLPSHPRLTYTTINSSTVVALELLNPYLEIGTVSTPRLFPCSKHYSWGRNGLPHCKSPALVWHLLKVTTVHSVYFSVSVGDKNHLHAYTLPVDSYHGAFYCCLQYCYSATGDKRMFKMFPSFFVGISSHYASSLHEMLLLTE